MLIGTTLLRRNILLPFLVIFSPLEPLCRVTALSAAIAAPRLLSIPTTAVIILNYLKGV